MGLDIHHSTFYDHLKKYPDISDALERGRFQAKQACAATIIAAATGKNRDPKWTLEFLKRHSEGWREKQEVEVEHSGEVQMHHESKLDEKTQERMALTFLQLQGYTVTPPAK